MALTSASGRPNAGSVTQRNATINPKQAHGRRRVPQPSARPKLPTKGSGDTVKVVQRGDHPPRDGEWDRDSRAFNREDTANSESARREGAHVLPLPAKPSSQPQLHSVDMTDDSRASSTDSETLGVRSPDRDPLYREFKAFGIDAFPSLALKREICIDFISGVRWCPWSSQCYRIHPRDKLFYLRLLMEGKAKDLFHQEDIVVVSSDSEGPQEDLLVISSGSGRPQPSVLLTKPDSQANSGVPAKSYPAATKGDLVYPEREYGWNPSTGQWNFNLDQEAWRSEDSSSSEGSDDRFHGRGVFHRSRNSSDTEEDTGGPSFGLRPPRLREACRDFLKGACNWGPSCRFYHSVGGNPGGVSPRVQASSSVFLPGRPSRPGPAPTISSGRIAPPPYPPQPLPNPPPQIPAASHVATSQAVRPPRSLPGGAFPSPVEEKQAAIALQVQASRPPPPPAPLPPRFRTLEQVDAPDTPGTCMLWLQGKCWRGNTCRFLHPDIESERHSSSPQTATPSTLPLKLYQRPPFDGTCEAWLRGECQRGPLCNLVHGDIEYDQSRPARKLIKIPPRPTLEVFPTVIYKYIKIQVTEGFEIAEVVTGFETSWIYVGNVPRRVEHEQLSTLLKAHGELVDLRIPENPTTPFVVVKARFVDAASASKACLLVDGLEAFGSTLSAKLSISINSNARVHLNDTSVRVTWEAPTKTAFVGFTSKESYQNAMSKCRSVALGKHLVKATPHTGIPAVGRFNLRVEAVPADTDVDQMKEFLEADAVMWGKGNYTSSVKALNGIQKMLTESGFDILEFNVMPPPFKSGMVVAWAHFATSADAKKFCDYMHGRKPHFTGNTRISARHVQSLDYALPKEGYENVRRDIDALAASAWRMGHFSVTTKVSPASVLVRLGGEDTQGLSKLKAELDVILSGEIVREKGKVVWDRFFPQPVGLNFIAELQRQHAPLTICVDKIRKRIRLFGASTSRLAARMKIMEKVEELRKQTTFTLSLDGLMFGEFMTHGLSQLANEVGEDSVQLDLWNRSLAIRGDQHVFNAVRDFVIRTRRTLVSKRLPVQVECPVCFDEVSAPVTLCCGHSWCKTCIIRYMMTAVDQKVFPLTCLGADAKCEEKIPLSCARQLLPPPDFEALIEASFSTYIHQHFDEFSYCPTPDCQQVYRHIPHVDVPKEPGKIQKSNSSSSLPSTSVGTILQCPSCLVRICASCQTEAHDGLACVKPGESDTLFDEWMKNNDVKPCPGCKMPIEKAMGCHHVTCTVCSIHICWLCLTPFHNGAGVYSHMLAVHGTFV